MLIFVAMLMQLPVPLLAIHLLSINLVTDAFPAFALGMEEKEGGIMNKKPRDPNEPIVDKKMMIAIAIQSIALAIGCLASFIIGYRVFDDFEMATTMCFITIIVGELLRSYSARSEHKSIFKMRILSNSFLNKSVLISILFLVATVYIPFLQPIFRTQALSASHFIIALVLAIIPVLGGEVAKVINR